MIHLLAQLDPMVWLMMVVVAIGFAVSAAVLVELLPGSERGPAMPPPIGGEADARGAPGDEQDDPQAPPL
jgi:hypothetical protein